MYERNSDNKYSALKFNSFFPSSIKTTLIVFYHSPRFTPDPPFSCVLTFPLYYLGFFRETEQMADTYNKELYYKELAHIVTEAKSHNILSVSLRLWKAKGIVLGWV